MTDDNTQKQLEWLRGIVKNASARRVSGFSSDDNTPRLRKVFFEIDDELHTALKRIPAAVLVQRTIAFWRELVDEYREK